MKLFSHRPSPAMVVALVGLFVGLGGVGLAANAQSLILGQGNSATAQTGLSSNTSPATLALTNSVGSPLKLNAPNGVAPLAVSNSTKVAGLNADKLDGIDSTGFIQGTGRSRSAVLVESTDSVKRPFLSVLGGGETFDASCSPAAGNSEAELDYTNKSAAPVFLDRMGEQNGSFYADEFIQSVNQKYADFLSSLSGVHQMTIWHVSPESGANQVAVVLTSISFDATKCVFRASVLQSG